MPPPPPPPQEKYIPNALKFVFGGAAGMLATCVVQPLDLIKTRMQLGGIGRSSFTVASEIVTHEGFLALYNGLSAGLLRQASYTTVRLGVFNYLFDAYREEHNGAPPGFGAKTLMGIVAGGVGSFVGTPAEVALIRMMADGRLNRLRRRNYNHVLDAIIRIINEEGVLNLWRGATPTVCRAMVVNAVQLVTYAQVREMLVGSVHEGVLLHFCASMTSSFVTTIVSMPIDIVKTEIQNASKSQSQVDVATNLLRTEGILSFWKGFLPYYARLGPHTVLTFIFLEQMHAAYFHNFGMLAACIVQPLDLIKTRMQLGGRGRSSFTVAKEIIHKEGFFALYNGLSAALLRQASYTTARLGVFNYLFDTYREANQGAAPGFGAKTLMGVCAGGVGSFIGTPAEVALIRMTADGRLPKEKRRNYKSVVDAISRIIKEEGVLKLWRGATPTVCRAMVVNAAQLGTYAQAREMLIAYLPDGIFLHFCASMTSGLITTIASMPVDIIKTKIQNAEKGQSQVAIVTNLIKKEGVLSFWKGFLPYYARLGPHTVLTFIFLEQMNAAYFRLQE